jgi:hypothetical protein
MWAAVSFGIIMASGAEHVWSRFCPKRTGCSRIAFAAEAGSAGALAMEPVAGPCYPDSRSTCDRDLALAHGPERCNPDRRIESFCVPRTNSWELAAHSPRHGVCAAHLLDAVPQFMDEHDDDTRSVALTRDIRPGAIRCRQCVARTIGVLSIVAVCRAARGV